MAFAPLTRGLAHVALTLIVLDVLLAGWWFITALLSAGNFDTLYAFKIGGMVATGIAVAALLLAFNERAGVYPGLLMSLALAAVPVGYVYLGPVLRARDLLHSSKKAEPSPPDLRPFADAIDRDDEAAIRRLTSRPVDWAAHLPDTNDTTLLGHALSNANEDERHVATFRILVEAGADINVSRLYGSPLLKAAAQAGRQPHSYELVKLMLDHGADPNPQGDSDAPLPFAGSNPDIVKLLLERGADVNSEDHGFTATSRFISNNYSDEYWKSALILVQAGADIDYEEPDGITIERHVEISRGSNPIAQEVAKTIEGRRARRKEAAK